MSELHLTETKHPNDTAERRFAELVGIDQQKELLLDHLLLLLDQDRLRGWARKHHGKGLALMDRIAGRIPAVLLSGEVGCGKTALATAVATPLAKALNTAVVCFETPSDIRGSGRVGEISARITAAFQQAKSKITRNSYGILIIDEADDLATSRAQMQAHHEDRAGLNVLVKQLDLLERERVHVGVLLITNRDRALDPAVVRRMSLHLRFDRPGESARKQLFSQILAGVRHSSADLETLVQATAPQPIPYSYSDLVGRLIPTALYRAFRQDQALSIPLLVAAVKDIEPSPLMNDDDCLPKNRK